MVDEIEDSDGTAEFVRAEFADPDEVSALAESVRGSVDTLDVLCEFGRAFPGFSTELWQLFDRSPFTESVGEGASTLVYLAVSPECRHDECVLRAPPGEQTVAGGPRPRCSARILGAER